MALMIGTMIYCSPADGCPSTVQYTQIQSMQYTQIQSMQHTQIQSMQYTQIQSMQYTQIQSMQYTNTACMCCEAAVSLLIVAQARSDEGSATVRAASKCMTLWIRGIRLVLFMGFFVVEPKVHTKWKVP
jgi:hypothetical protein